MLVAAEDQIEMHTQALEYLQLQIRVLYWGLQRSEELHELFNTRRAPGGRTRSGAFGDIPPSVF